MSDWNQGNQSWNQNGGYYEEGYNNNYAQSGEGYAQSGEGYAQSGEGYYQEGYNNAQGTGYYEGEGYNNNYYEAGYQQTTTPATTDYSQAPATAVVPSATYEGQNQLPGGATYQPNLSASAAPSAVTPSKNPPQNVPLIVKPSVDPSRWIKESEVATCQNCSVKFTLTRKRHRCRACGGIFCDGCSQDRLEVQGLKGPQRVCFLCYSANAPLSPEHDKMVDEYCAELKETPIYKTMVVMDKEGGGSAFTAATRHAILVVTHYRILYLKRSSKRLYKADHILDLIGIDIPSKGKAALTYRRKVLLQETAQQDQYVQGFQSAHVADVILALRTEHARTTRGCPALFNLPVQANQPEWLLPISNDVLSKPIIAGGFCELYAAWCNYYSCGQPSDELIQYVIESTTTDEDWPRTTLVLTYCPGIERNTDLAFDLRPVFSSLRYNTFFLGLELSDAALPEAIQLLAECMRTNATLTRLTLTNLDTAYVTNLGRALAIHHNNSIQELDLSYTPLSDKAVKSLATALYHKKFGLRSIKVAGCGITSKSLNILLKEGLIINFNLSLFLEEFDISNNRLDEDGSLILRSWFEKVGSRAMLQKLWIAGTRANLDFVLPALTHLTRLKFLDVSNNPVLTMQANHYLCEWASVCRTLEYVNVANCQMDPDSIALLVTAVSGNSGLADTSLNLAGNLANNDSILAFAGCISPQCNIRVLDLSEAKLDELGVTELCGALVRCGRKVDTLVLNTFCTNVSTDIAAVKIGHALADMLVNTPNIKYLKLADGAKGMSTLNLLSSAEEAKQIVLTFIRRLWNNTTLLQLDVSNNRLGDVAASAIGEMLRYNNTLLSLDCDGNKITLSGWQSIEYAMRRNGSLQRLEYPSQDIQRCTQQYSGNVKKQKRMFNVITAIQLACNRNVQNAGGLNPRLAPPPVENPPAHALDLEQAMLAAGYTSVTSTAATTPLAADYSAEGYNEGYSEGYSEGAGYSGGYSEGYNEGGSSYAASGDQSGWNNNYNQ